SFIQLAKHNNIEVKVEPVSVKKVIEAHKEGTLKEVWGVGTAVVLSVFQALGYKDDKMVLPQLSEEESFAIKLKNQLVSIQTNTSED
ncbi:branched chain amino acid aminotransferase, partial [Escherichia coli]